MPKSNAGGALPPSLQKPAEFHAVAEIALRHGYRAGVQLHKVFDLP